MLLDRTGVDPVILELTLNERSLRDEDDFRSIEQKATYALNKRMSELLSKENKE